MRFFTTEGPVDCGRHYRLPPLERLDLAEVRMLIDQQEYFAIHAPPRSGKTTYLLALAEHLNQEGRHRAVYASCKLTNTDGSDFEDNLRNLTEQIARAAQAQVGDADALAIATQVNTTSRGISMLGAFLTLWCGASRLPIVLLFDDLHALSRDTLFALLRQLRSHHPQRPTHFPQSIILCGVHDVRDYGIHLSSGQAFPSGNSVFNIKAASLGLDDFRPAQVEHLLLQHVKDTGRVFTPGALRLASDLTQGQPWLVNALARQAVQVVAPDPTQPVDMAEINQAKELLIQRQDTHLDSLAERLREPRVRHVIEPLLAGRALTDVPMDDIRFVLDLGLCQMDPAGGLVIANPIYREVIPRVLAGGPQASLPHIRPTWLRPDGSLDPARLLEAFLAFWRQHGQPLLGSAPYHEIAPHLVLMAFLHRVVNGGGTLEREYAIGSGRMDLCLRYGDVTLGIELKVWRDGESDPLEEGLAQLDAYLAGLGLATGWLVIFDRRIGQPPISRRTHSAAAETPAGRAVTVIRA